MEGPHEQSVGRAYPETFGIEPTTYEREIPEVIRSLGEALHRFEREAGNDDDIRDEFAGVYPAQKIEADLAEVHRLEHVFDAEDDLASKKSRLYATVLELIVQDMAHEWFPECVIWRSSRFDDYKRQTDLFMDIPDPDGGWLTVALDVTSSRDGAFKKVGDVLDEMRGGWFHTVDYFASDIEPGRPKGRTFMPRFVVGASKSSIASLARLYGQWRRHGPTVSSRTKEEELDKLRFHTVGQQLYEELIRQADLGHDFMQRLLKDTPTFQETRRSALKTQATYLGKIGRELEHRLKDLRRGAVEHEKQGGGASPAQIPPPNKVLDAILQRAG